MVISSCSLRNVITEPAKLTEPTTMVNAVAIRVKIGADAGAAGDLVQLDQGDDRRRAAADAVEQGDELRHLGHLHPVGADDADQGADAQPR